MISWIVSSSVLIICVILIRHLLKGRISPGLQYALWGIVLLRLLIPVNFGNSKISVENFTDDIAEVYESEAVWEIINYDTGSDSSTVVSNIGKSVAPVSTLEKVVPAEVEETEVKEQKLNVGSLLIWLDNALVYIWAAGMIVVALAFIYTNVRFTIRVARDRERIVEKEKWDLPVYYSDNVETPCLYGIINPKIYVNAETIMDDKAFRHVREHELTHYHHGDNVWCVFRFMALVVHWYNPLVWLAAVLSRKDSELACDAGTIKRLGESERVGYGMTLINMSCRKKEAVFAMATTMAGSKKNIQERVVLIAKKPKTAMRTLVAVVLTMAAIVGVTFTGAVKAAELPLTKTEQDSSKVLREEAQEAVGAGSIAVVNEKYAIRKVDYSNFTWNELTDYCAGSGVSYMTDIYDRVIYGLEGSFLEIYAGRNNIPFIILEEKDLENVLVKAIYDMYSPDGLEITYYEPRNTAHETYASFSPNNVMRLIELINMYTWKQIDGLPFAEIDYMIGIASGDGLYKRSYMQFYDIGDGVIFYNDGYHKTYWKAEAKAKNTASIAEQLKEDYDNIELELTCIEISGCSIEQQAFEYLVREVYPSTRLELEDGDPYKLSYYRLRSSARETTTDKKVREGHFTFECMPEGKTEIVEKTIEFTVEATDRGTWIFQYHDCDKE